MSDLQRTNDWFAERCGKVTASRIADVMAKTRSGWGAGRANYMAELVAERLTGETQQGYQNAAMRWGIEHEADAADVYAFETGLEVLEVGFVEHPEIDMTGASPDRLVGDDGVLEIKCPNTATHIDFLRTGKLPDKYLKQMLWQLACLPDRSWNDYVSYDPRMPLEMQFKRLRVQREEHAKEIEAIEGAVVDFLEELNDIIDELQTNYGDLTC